MRLEYNIYRFGNGTIQFTHVSQTVGGRVGMNQMQPCC